jgi:hypothetical protein
MSISYGSLQSIIKNELLFRKISAWWVPRLHDNARTHSAALTRETLAQMYWTAIEHPSYSPDLSPCDHHMFGLLKDTPGGAAFRRWWAGQESRAQMATDTSSFILWCRNKKTPNPLAKMHRERGNYVEKWEFLYFVKLCFNKKLKNEVGLYLIYPRRCAFVGSLYSVNMKLFEGVHWQTLIYLF